MSEWQVDNITGQGDWDDVLVAWDDLLTTWDALDTAWTNQVENTPSYTLESKNTVAPVPETDILIDGTYSLLIDPTYTLLSQALVAGYSLQGQKQSTYTLQERGNPKSTSQTLLIDPTYGLLIDSNFLLEIQEEAIPENWQLQTKN